MRSMRRGPTVGYFFDIYFESFSDPKKMEQILPLRDHDLCTRSKQ